MIDFFNRLLKFVIDRKSLHSKNLSENNFYKCENFSNEMDSQSMNRTQKVFFSYGHDDNIELVHRLKSDLELRGHQVWIDTTDIKSGDDWRRSITEGLTSSSKVLSFLSKHSVRSPGVCLDELKIALSVKGSYIKTVLLEKEEKVRPPTTLSNIQWLDMSNWKEVKSNGKVIWDEWYEKSFRELCSVIESDEALVFSGEIQRLRSLLRPNLSETKEQNLLNTDYIGRIWLENELEKWRTTQNDSKAFVILGGPGIGKSSFAAHLLHYNHNVLCGIFCEWDKTSSTDAKNVFQTLSYKLATKLPDYRKILLEKLDGVEGNGYEQMNSAEYFDALLVHPLNELIDGGREQQIVFIDGLDEANKTDRNELAEVLASNMFKLPSWIVFLLTSRPEYNIRTQFSYYNPFVLEPTDNRNLEDIRKFIAYSLSDELAKVEDRLFVLHQITQRCQGSFLYASLFVEGIKTKMFDLNQTSEYPNGLDAFYFQNFRRKFPQITDYRKVHSFLEIVSSCQDIPIAMASKVLNLSTYELNDFLAIFGSLIQETSLRYDYVNDKLDCVSFCHKSLSDWIVDRNKSGIYFIDLKNGYEKLADFSLSYVHSNGKTVIQKPSQYFVGQVPQVKINLLDDYIKNKMHEFFIHAEHWDQYRDFLLEHDTPLMPYWSALKQFPSNYNYSSLINRLWSDPHRFYFFETLQRLGESQFILMLIEKYIKINGLEKLDIRTLNIYIDIVHLSGDYEHAVILCDSYLSQYQESDIYGNKDLLRLSIRKLHHSMFYAPVEGLLDDARFIEKMINSTKFPEEFNELLFLIGGNLGMLHGNFVYARVYLERSLDFARKHDYFDYESRTIRKFADLLCIEGQLDDALDLVSRYVSCDEEIISRYQLYLLASMGEIFRRQEQFDKALNCFMNLGKLSEQRGILGWKAHSLLATANLFFKKGHLLDAKTQLDKAEVIYSKIGQKWGIIQVEIIRYGILLGGNSKPSLNDKQKLESLLENAQSMQYLHDINVIKHLISGNFPKNFQLLFL